MASCEKSFIYELISLLNDKNIVKLLFSYYDPSFIILTNQYLLIADFANVN